MQVRMLQASTPGRPLGEVRPGIDCLCMHRIFRILSSKFDRKLNHPRKGLVPIEVKGEHIRFHNTKSLRRVYDYQVFRVI